jgi:isopenicillin N synthase-like dioxygenase
MDDLPVISLADATEALPGRLGESFARHGFALVSDHGIDPDLISRGWELTAAFFALPEAEKRRYHVPGGAGQRGYTPFASEVAKGARVHDLKEFWHVGREAQSPNTWPDTPEEFRETFTALFAAFDAAGNRILAHIARYLGLPSTWFDPAVAEGNSVLRLLHYPPLADGNTDALRAAPHEDINLITLLLGAEEAGLELLDRSGRWLAVEPPPDALVVNIGDMLQRLTNRVLPSTTHRVRNPEGERRHRSRYAMPFFLHLRSDFLIEPLPGCITTTNPSRYPDPISAGDYLAERLREIGLKPEVPAP